MERIVIVGLGAIGQRVLGTLARYDNVKSDAMVRRSMLGADSKVHVQHLQDVVALLAWRL